MLQQSFHNLYGRLRKHFHLSKYGNKPHSGINQEGQATIEKFKGNNEKD